MNSKTGNMQFEFFKKIIACILAFLQLSCNQQSRCTTYTMNKKFIGSLHENRTKPLWEIEKENVGLVMHFCFSKCERDQRCVGIEICTIRSDLSRCRGCCEWYVVDNDGGFPRNATDGCKYFELSQDNVESRGIRLNVPYMSANSNLSAVASSTYINKYEAFPASNVLDGLYGNNCYTKMYSSIFETNPWLEVKWTGTIKIWRIIIYNRFFCCGSRLVNLNVTYKNNGVTGVCGFYPGLMSHNGDLILFHCPQEAHATSVMLQIQSKPGYEDKLHFCEVEIYKKN